MTSITNHERMPSMRRSRFTATLSRIDSDAIGVRRYVVLGVERGDWRTTNHSSGFAIDQDALAEAIELLGLKWPVRLTFTRRAGRVNGSHQVRFDGATYRSGKCYGLDTTARAPFHRILVKSYLTAEQAGRTLWHELAHAMQAEREAADAGASTPREIHNAWSTYSARGRGVTYRAKPIEVEAREYEPLNDDLPLAR